MGLDRLRAETMTAGPFEGGVERRSVWSSADRERRRQQQYEWERSHPAAVDDQRAASKLDGLLHRIIIRRDRSGARAMSCWRILLRSARWRGER
jgi:hypothetical protein